MSASDAEYGLVEYATFRVKPFQFGESQTIVFGVRVAFAIATGPPPENAMIEVFVPFSEPPREYD